MAVLIDANVVISFLIDSEKQPLTMILKGLIF